MSYEARKKELMDALEETGFEADRQEKIRRGLEGYFRQREGRLENLLELLEPGTQPTFKTWLDKAMDAVKVTHDTFAKIDEGNEWLAAVATQEHKFFFRVYRCQAGKHRDRMVAQTENLEKAMKELENKWEKIKDGDEKIDEKMKKVAERYEEILVSAAQVAAVTEKQAKERMADTVKKVLTLGLAAVDLGAVEKVLSGGASALGAKLDETKARQLEIFALLSREEQMFGTFKETREIVAEFLEDNGYPMIKDAFDDAEDAAEALEKSMVTDGQKRDAAEFAKAMKSELEKVFSAAERQYRDFAKKHEYLFFGPLGSGYVQELAEDETWKSFSRGWKDHRRDFDDLLRERTLAADEDEILEVPLDDLEGEDAQRVYYQLRDACQKLMRAWNEWKDFTNDPDWILENREDLRSILKALR